MVFVWVREQACSTSGKWLSSRADCTHRLLTHLPRKQTACPGTSNACLEALRPHSLAGRAPNPSGPPQPRPAPGGAGPAPGRSGAASCLPAPGDSGCGGERALTGTRRFLHTRTRSRPGELRNGEGGCRDGISAPLGSGLHPLSFIPLMYRCSALNQPGGGTWRGGGGRGKRLSHVRITSSTTLLYFFGQFPLVWPSFRCRAFALRLGVGARRWAREEENAAVLLLDGPSSSCLALSRLIFLKVLQLRDQDIA